LRFRRCKVMRKKPLSPLSARPMEARLAAALPAGAWQYEPKWDGFRCLAFRDGESVELRAKSGKSLTRFFPEVVACLRHTRRARFVLDGELVIWIGRHLSFDALQMRLHPAESRIRKLAERTPARYMLFDVLADGRRDLTALPLGLRREALESLFKKFSDSPCLRLTPATGEIAKAKKWLNDASGTWDGVVAKAVDAPYLQGERAMIKVKRLRTADCVVGGFRYASGSPLVGSLLLGLYDESGKLNHVGFTSGIADADRPALTKMLQRLRGGAGFTGDAPGAPSRWSTERSAAWEPLKPKLVAEVRYDHVSGSRFRHGTRFLRWRPDKLPRQCTFDQLALAARRRG